jgi:Cu/Ag efflux pump CusA
VLAIGIVVDDAIVIVENAAHHIERGLAAARGHHPRDERGDRAGHRRSRWC